MSGALQLRQRWLLQFGRLWIVLQIGAHEAANQTDPNRAGVGAAADLVRMNLVGLAMIDHAVGRHNIMVGDAWPLVLDQLIAPVTLAENVIAGDLLHAVGERRVGVMHRNQADRPAARRIGRQCGMRGQLADHLHQRRHRHAGRLHRLQAGDLSLLLSDRGLHLCDRGLACAEGALQRLNLRLQIGHLAADFRQTLHFGLRLRQGRPQPISLLRQTADLSDQLRQFGAAAVLPAVSPAVVHRRFGQFRLHSGQQRLLETRPAVPLGAGRANPLQFHAPHHGADL